jgi:hypothetical protein
LQIKSEPVSLKKIFLPIVRRRKSRQNSSFAPTEAAENASVSTPRTIITASSAPSITITTEAAVVFQVGEKAAEYSGSKTEAKVHEEVEQAPSVAEIVESQEVPREAAASPISLPNGDGDGKKSDSTDFV